MSIRLQMLKELREKKIFEQARKYAFDYLEDVDDREVFPTPENLNHIEAFDEPLPNHSTSAENLLQQLHELGSPATIAQAGGRYFGFVNGGAIPVSLGVKWLSDVWDQCAGLYLTSPINAKLEAVCEQWLKEIFNLPESTVAGFVSGTSMANLSALAAARYHLLKNLGWDINENGLNGAPKIRIIAHQQVHASIRKTLAMLGFGRNSIEWIPSDEQGRVVVKELPLLNNSCLVLLQAGNVNTGAYDDFDQVCDLANKAGAWVHIDGAFGLWAAATKSLSYLTKGMEKAASWAVDGHKTLNTPYDSGIVLCRYPEALISALQATGEYLTYSEQRDPLWYGPEMSKRARAVELWACMKYLGRAGIDELVTTLHQRAKQLELGLKAIGVEVLNEVVFNQVLISCGNDEKTKKVIFFVQNSGECWMGASTWNNKAVIRISVCSWRTSEEDIKRTIKIVDKAMSNVE